MVDTKIKDLTSRTPAVGDQIPINDISGPDQDGQVTVGACLDIVAGDVNVDSSGVSTIPNNTVTYAKIQDVSATDRILGRDSAGAGDIEEITPANLRTMINVADGATANSSDATLLNRANHTGTQTASTISDYASATASFTNKTFDVAGTGNKLTSTSIALGDLLKGDGTDFKRFARGSSLQQLRVNSGGTDLEWATISGGTSNYTMIVPIVMEVPNDTVAYPDIFALGDAGSKISGFFLPNSAASEICFKCVVPNDLHGTPAAKVVIYMLPRTTVSNSTVNLQIKRLYVDTTEDVDAAFTSESAVDVDITSTADFLTRYEYDVTAEPTAGELFHGILKRDPAAANDDFTEDLFIVGMYLQIEVATT
jgi:hypothetical protein